MNKTIVLFSSVILVLVCTLLLGNASYAVYTSNYSEPSISLKRGTYGTGVKWLQDMLNHNGYSITVDGVFGNSTYNTVINFQANKNLITDGIVGPATKTALKKYASNNQLEKYIYTTTRVNFRSGPSITYNSYGVLDQNTKVVFIKKYNDSWSQVKYNNTFGYINSNYLKDDLTISPAITNANVLPTFNRGSTSLLEIIKNCKSYYANNNFYYSTASGVRTIPADKSTNYSNRYYVDCSSFVTWVLYEYASVNNNMAMKSYFSYQRNSVTFANIGANNGNDYLEVVSKKTNDKIVNLQLAKPGDILVSNGHVEFFSSYTYYSDTYVNIKVYNCGSDSSIKASGTTTSATLSPSDITYILRVK